MTRSAVNNGCPFGAKFNNSHFHSPYFIFIHRSRFFIHQSRFFIHQFRFFIQRFQFLLTFYLLIKFFFEKKGNISVSSSSIVFRVFSPSRRLHVNIMFSFQHFPPQKNPVHWVSESYPSLLCHAGLYLHSFS